MYQVIYKLPENEKWSALTPLLNETGVKEILAVRFMTLAAQNPNECENIISAYTDLCAKKSIFLFGSEMRMERVG